MQCAGRHRLRPGLVLASPIHQLSNLYGRTQEWISKDVEYNREREHLRNLYSSAESGRFRAQGKTTYHDKDGLCATVQWKESDSQKSHN